MAIGEDPAYLSATMAEALFHDKEFPPPSKLLRNAYKAHFVKSERFDKTLFHYLLARLGKAKDSFAADHALGLLKSIQKRQTTFFGILGSSSHPRAMKHNYWLFWRQRKQYTHTNITKSSMVGWRSAGAMTNAVAYARKAYRATDSSSYLRSAARLLLARYRSAADLDHLANSYSLVPQTSNGQKSCVRFTE